MLFADYATGYVQDDSTDDAIQILNPELSKVTLWFDSNKFTHNVDKTQTHNVNKTQTHNVNKTQTIMCSRKKLAPHNKDILRNEVVEKSKILGEIVDQRLDWKDHFRIISQKNSKSCGIIYLI